MTMDYGTALFGYTALLKICDMATIAGVWYGAWHLRFNTNLIPVTKGIPEFSSYSRATWTLMLVYLAIFHVVGVYRRDRIHLGMKAIRKVFQGSLLGLLGFISVSYLLKNVEYSRAFLTLLPALIFPALVFERVGLHICWQVAQTKLVKRIRTLVIGHGSVLPIFIRQINHRRSYPTEWLGRLGQPDSNLDQYVAYLGDEKHLEDKIIGLSPDQVIVGFPSEEASHYDKILLRLGNFPVTVKVLPDFGKFNTFTYEAAEECGVPILIFNQLSRSNSARSLKRIMDFTLSFIGIVILLPFFLCIALLIKLTSKGPVLYSQKRIGSNGHIFDCLKFRTMLIDAESGSGPVWARENDPRTTKIGRWLRRLSLDELPQLFNVLRGDMSLVGPRPERPHFVDQFSKEVPKYLLRHRMKSGLTGWAQVNGWRGNTSIEERIKYDLYYIGHWSLRFDIKILLLTPFRGLVHKNAY